MKLRSISRKSKSLLVLNKPHIFFMRIPKAGSTSVNSAIKQHYPGNSYEIDSLRSLEATKALHYREDTDFNKCLYLRGSLVAYAMAKDERYITGHVPYVEPLAKAQKSKYKYVALLRDPIKRFISKYFFNFQKADKHCDIDVSLSEYLDSEKGIQSGCEYVKYFTGALDVNVHQSKHLLETAKTNLSNFNVVGALEDLNRFKSDFYAETGINLKIPYKNKGKASKSESELTKAILEKIKHVCEPDLILYDYAIELGKQRSVKY